MRCAVQTQAAAPRACVAAARLRVARCSAAAGSARDRVAPRISSPPTRHVARAPTRLAAAGGGANGGPPTLTLHLGETMLAFPFAPSHAQELEAALNGTLAEFRAKETWERPRRLSSMEFKVCSSDAAPGAPGVSVEIFCNPNAYASAFAAKAMVTLAAGGVKVTAEGPLSALRQDLEQFKAAHR